jgi:hypothetical protein
VRAAARPIAIPDLQRLQRAADVGHFTKPAALYVVPFLGLRTLFPLSKAISFIRKVSP